MKVKLFLLFVVTLSYGFSQQKDNDAIEKLLNSVNKNINAFDNVTIEFKILARSNTQLNAANELEGKLIYAKGKYKLEIFDVLQLFDGEKAYLISNENEEVTIIDPKDTEELMFQNPLRFLSEYKSIYTYTWDIKQTIQNNIELQYVKLIPNGEENSYLLIGIDREKVLPYKIIQVVNKEQTTITLEYIEKNKPLPNDFFTFDKKLYKDYYINQ